MRLRNKTFSFVLTVLLVFFASQDASDASLALPSTAEFPGGVTTISFDGSEPSEDLLEDCGTAVLEHSVVFHTPVRQPPFESESEYIQQMEALLKIKFPGAEMARVTRGGESFLYKVKFNGEVLAVKFPRFLHPNPYAAYRNEQHRIRGLSREAKRWFVPLRELDYLGPFMVMDYVGTGETLLSRLSDFGPDAEALFVLRTMLKIAHAVKFLHDQGIGHLDIKPENILLEPSAPGIRLADLTLATRFGSPIPYLRPGRIAGTPEYMPVEALLARVAFPGWDLYSLKITFQGMALGEYPFLTVPHSFISMDYSMGREIKRLKRSPYSVLKSSGVDPIISALSYVRFENINLLIEGIKKAIWAHRNSDFNSFFREFYGPKVLEKLTPTRAARLVNESDELKERLGESPADSQLGLSTDFHLAIRTLLSPPSSEAAEPSIAQ